MRVNGEEREVPLAEVAAIDFLAGPPREAADGARLPAKGHHIIWLRTGESVDGQLYDISGGRPLRVIFRTSTGERQFASSEIGRIVLSSDAQPVATTGTSPQNATDGVTIEVAATAAWMPTDVVVQRGELMSFTATGQIQLSADTNDIASPAGARSKRASRGTRPMPAVPSGALIARIGEGAPFLIGDQTSSAMTAGDRVFLGINDDQPADNSGAFTVIVQRSTRR
jgi:hypothetical protein